MVKMVLQEIWYLCLIKRELILNLPIFGENGGHFVCYHGDGGLTGKVQYIFTRQDPAYSLGRKIALTMQIKNKILFVVWLTAGVAERYWSLEGE